MLLPGKMLVEMLVVDPTPKVRLELAVSVPVSMVAEYTADALLLDEAIAPLVVIPLEPMARGAVRVAPFAERVPVRVALEAYTFLQAFEDVPKS